VGEDGMTPDVTGSRDDHPLIPDVDPDWFWDVLWLWSTVGRILNWTGVDGEA
jgi:hypothetical protein